MTGAVLMRSHQVSSSEGSGQLMGGLQTITGHLREETVVVSEFAGGPRRTEKGPMACSIAEAASDS